MREVTNETKTVQSTYGTARLRMLGLRPYQMQILHLRCRLGIRGIQLLLAEGWVRLGVWNAVGLS